MEKLLFQEDRNLNLPYCNYIDSITHDDTKKIRYLYSTCIVRNCSFGANYNLKDLGFVIILEYGVY